MTIMEAYMKLSTISIAEGKRDFSRIINDASQNKEEIIVTKRGKPVAVIVPYDEYLLRNTGLEP